MAARYQDLVAWQLTEALRREVIAFTKQTGVASDRRFCDQIRDAAGSGSRNLAEGFLRYSHRDFARFVEIARASVGEVQSELVDACSRGYLSESEQQRLRMLADRAIGALTRLHAYLHATPDPAWARPPNSRR